MMKVKIIYKRKFPINSQNLLCLVGFDITFGMSVETNKNMLSSAFCWLSICFVSNLLIHCSAALACSEDGFTGVNHAEGWRYRKTKSSVSLANRKPLASVNLVNSPIVSKKPEHTTSWQFVDLTRTCQINKTLFVCVVLVKANFEFRLFCALCSVSPALRDSENRDLWRLVCALCSWKRLLETALTSTRHKAWALRT